MFVNRTLANANVISAAYLVYIGFHKQMTDEASTCKHHHDEYLAR